MLNPSYVRLDLELKNKGLTKIQRKIAQLVSMGLSNAEVANQLFLTETGVKLNIGAIYAKLNLKSRAQLIVWCLPLMPFLNTKAF